MDPLCPKVVAYIVFFWNKISPKIQSSNVRISPFWLVLAKKNCMDSGRKKPFCGGTGTGGDDFSVTGSSEGFLWKNGGCKKFNIHWIDASDELNWLRFCVVRMIYDWFWNWLWGIYGKSPLETVISFEAFRNPWEPVLKVHVVIFGYRYCFGKPPRSRSYLYHPIFSLMLFWWRQIWWCFVKLQRGGVGFISGPASRISGSKEMVWFCTAFLVECWSCHSINLPKSSPLGPPRPPIH